MIRQRQHHWKLLVSRSSIRIILLLHNERFWAEKHPKLSKRGNEWSGYKEKVKFCLVIEGGWLVYMDFFRN